MPSVFLPENNVRVLELLAVYRFLTVPQFMALGLSDHKPSIYRIMSRFKVQRNRLLKKKDFGFERGFGNRSSVYFLTRQGAAFVADLERRDRTFVHFPIGNVSFGQDYFHRVATIDFHIAFRQWAISSGAEVDFFATYFDKSGSNRSRDRSRRLRAKTRVGLEEGFIVPDAVLGYTTKEGSGRLSVLEIHNGMDTRRFERQLDVHLRAMEEGAINEEYQFFSAYTILWVFELEAARDAAIRRVRQRADLDAFRDYLRFASAEDVRANYETSWMRS
ncbi:replication-relaxation family protein [Rhodothermus sp. AH-315-K08]|nr:replication-relaxation family protein [Rhodothermus sp. AH-315-K08]